MLTLFSTPKAFRGHIDVIQRNALRSWKLLHPDVEVILFGDDDGTAEVCQQLDLRHIPDVLRSSFGTKRLDSIFGRAQEIARHPLMSYVNCDIILTKEFLKAAEILRTWRSRFLMVGRRWDTDITTPLDFSTGDWQECVIARAKQEGIQRFYHNIDYFLFQRGTYLNVPPLVIGRIWWDHWLVGKAHAQGVAVVDVSEVVCAVHQNHDYGYHAKGIEGVWRDEEAKRNFELASCDARLRTIEDAPYRLTRTGVRENRTYWLAPLKRRWRGLTRSIRSAVRTNVWHPLLDATRAARHAVGLKKDIIPSVIRAHRKRHWMDE